MSQLFSRVFITLALFLSVTLVVAVAAVSLYPPTALPYDSKLIALVGLLALFAPRVAISIFLVALPIFGNRPGSHQLLYYVYVSSGLFGGLIAGALVRREPVLARRDGPASHHPLIFFAALYLAVTILSLSGLPVLAMGRELLMYFPDLRFSTIAIGLSRVLRSTETARLYPLLSVIFTAHAISIGYLIYCHARKDEKSALIYFWALFAGLICALLFGLLDYYGALNLRALRGLDPIVNPGDVQFRLQSFFGHSGWFAEYLTLLAPFSMLLLLLPIRFLYRVLLIVSVLLVGEFVLVLTYQRGGWLSYPLTLFGVWAAIYVTRRMEKGEERILPALKGSIVKVLVSIPVTVMITLGAISLFSASSGASNVSIKCYVHRFQQIGKTSDRTDFVRAGFKLGTLHPFLGGGSESFAQQYEKEFTSPGGRFRGQIKLPLHGSAHNVYMQTFAGKGIAGVAALLALVLVPAILGLRMILHEDRIQLREKILLLVGACFLLAFLIYGNVQEVFYVQILQTLFFVVLFCMAAISERYVPQLHRLTRFSWIAVAALFLAQMVWEYGYPGRLLAEIRAKPEFGCYGSERPLKGERFEWCTKNVRKRAVPNAEGRIQFRVMGAPAVNGSRVAIWVGDKPPVTISLRPDRPRQIDVPVLAPNEPQRWIDVNLRAERSFIPLRDMKHTTDPRALAFQLYSDEWIFVDEQKAESEELSQLTPAIRDDIAPGAIPVPDPCAGL